MPWVWLLLAGVVEVAWSQSIKPTEGFTKLPQTALCFVLMVSAVYLLSRAMKDLPTGTSYAVFTGIGTIGAIVLGVVVQHDALNLGRVTALVLLVAGLTVARLTTTG
ncbi:DMT family transporter [Yinghuangia seranimata]|uniref:DMT family transporter n=1 Tax=Yinghuangia seranimata TaxID=408067 RepID=UPI00248C290E|nr:multidrug efflux SMR transporter [Yinghuangia seranimata]MDI2131865.1 multidrug efflux SMR transporter [Yinghuangia seranimata]